MKYFIKSKKVKKSESVYKQKNHNECLGRTAEYFLSKMYLHPNLETIFKNDLINLSCIEKDISKFKKLKDYYPLLEYIGNRNHKYDFEYLDCRDCRNCRNCRDCRDCTDCRDCIHESKKYVSLKTNFKGSKVCPQVIGQTTFKKYRTHFHLDENISMDEMKRYMIENIDKILKEYINYTFHCDIIYYVKKKCTSQLFIIKHNEEKVKNIHFERSSISFSHIEKSKEWNESTTIYYLYEGKKYSIGEFQIHQHRNIIKFRWNFHHLLSLFRFEKIEII